MSMEVNPHYEHLREFVIALPSRFDQEGTLIYDDRNKIKKFTIGGETVVVKRFRRPNFVQKVAYTFFKKGKAERAYRNGGRLLELGFSTPVNIAFLETKHGGLLEDGFLVTGVDDTPPIRELLEWPAQFDRRLAKAFAAFAVSLHEKGVLHDDLNSTNVQYDDRGGDDIRFSLIDINRMHFREGWPPLHECLENITRFTYKEDLFDYVARNYIEMRGMGEKELKALFAAKKRHNFSRVRKKLMKKWLLFRWLRSR
ncbi:MAG: hypothetical protein II674_03735 [Prevotella sp.]|nr:hypothetical protein [Prevotella sp.]MBQ4294314.1 hypothetical protein [Prevotella sp.]